RVADPHEVPRLPPGQERRGAGDRLEHRVTLLPHAQAAEGVPVEAELDDLLDRAAPQLRVGRALRDSEEQLTRSARSLPLPFRPMNRWRPPSSAITSSPGRKWRWYVLPSRISPPSARSSSGSTIFTVAFVPTGMNAGVRSSPCAVRSTPARASPSLAVTWKL